MFEEEESPPAQVSESILSGAFRFISMSQSFAAEHRCLGLADLLLVERRRNRYGLLEEHDET